MCISFFEIQDGAQLKPVFWRFRRGLDSLKSDFGDLEKDEIKH